MVNGVVVGVVLDNRDPDGLHRVKVKYPVEGWVESTWCRMMTPMGGADRGLVILPDIGTEVLLGFAYRSLSPYVLGAVYNGEEDTPAPYRNDDGSDNKRVFWSRGDHLLVFDDTPGAEQVGLGARAPTRLDVRSAPVHHVLDAAGKELTERCEGTTLYEAKGTISMACTRFTLQADTVLLRGGSDEVCVSSEVKLSSGGTLTAASPNTQVAGG
jgi:uncharacterized protein involved in type VI secretion and phage assembly